MATAEIRTESKYYKNRVARRVEFPISVWREAREPQLVVFERRGAYLYVVQSDCGRRVVANRRGAKIWLGADRHLIPDIPDAHYDVSVAGDAIVLHLGRVRE